MFNEFDYQIKFWQHENFFITLRNSIFVFASVLLDNYCLSKILLITVISKY